MAGIFLTIYVVINIIIIVLNLVFNIFGDETIEILDGDDWLIFIVACGALAIVETLEKR